ncbi:hypothetical protein Bca4012_011794 [Brassica carinata]
MESVITSSVSSLHHSREIMVQATVFGFKKRLAQTDESCLDHGKTWESQRGQISRSEERANRRDSSSILRSGNSGRSRGKPLQRCLTMRSNVNRAGVPFLEIEILT